MPLFGDFTTMSALTVNAGASTVTTVTTRKKRPRSPVPSIPKHNHPNQRNLTENKFVASKSSSLISQLNRKGSTRKSGRPKAELHFNSKKTRQYQADVAQAAASTCREIIEQAAALVSSTLNLREALISESKIIANMLEKDHDRLLSKAQQRTAESAHGVFIARQQNLRSESNKANNGSASLLPSLTPPRLFPSSFNDAVVSHVPQRPAPNDTSFSERFGTSPRSLRILRLQEEAQVENRSAIVASLIAKMDGMDLELPSVKLEVVPFDMLEAMIRHISDKTIHNTTKRARMRRWFRDMLVDIGYQAPADSTIRRYLILFEAIPSILPTRGRGRPSMMPAGVLALVLADMSKATAEKYSLGMLEVKKLLATRRAEHANSQGNGDVLPSKSSNERYINTIRANSVSTKKSDSLTGTHQRWLAECWTGAWANAYMRWSMVSGPRFCLSREFCLAHPLERHQIFNIDAFQIVFKNGHDEEDTEVLVEYAIRLEHIFGARPKHGGKQPLRVAPFSMINAQGDYILVYPIALRTQDKILDDSKDIYPLSLPTNKVGVKCEILFYKNKDAISGESMKIKLFLYLLDEHFIPMILNVRRAKGWDGQIATLDPQTMCAGLNLDGEKCMLIAIEKRVNDGTFKKYLIRVFKTSPNTTGKQGYGQELDLLKTGFALMHKRIAKWLHNYVEYERLKELQTTTPNGVTGEVFGKDHMMFQDMKNWPLYRALKIAVSGGKNATLGLNIDKWRYAAVLLSAAAEAEAACFSSFDIMEAFDATSCYPGNVIKSISSSRGFANDCDEEERGFILAEEQDKMCKDQMCLKGGLDDEFRKEKKFPKSRLGEDRTKMDPSRRLAFELTHEVYQEGRATDLLEKIEKQEAIDAAADLRKKNKQEKAELMQSKKDARAAKKKQAAAAKQKAIDEKKERGKRLVLRYVTQRSFTHKDMKSYKKDSRGIESIKWKEMALFLGVSAELKKLSLIRPEVVRLVDAKVIGAHKTLLRDEEEEEKEEDDDDDDDDNDDESSSSSDDEDSGEDSDEDSSDEEDEEEQGVNAQPIKRTRIDISEDEEDDAPITLWNGTVYITKDYFNSKINNYALGSTVYFNDCIYWWRANQDNPCDNDHWEETGEVVPESFLGEEMYAYNHSRHVVQSDDTEDSEDIDDEDL